MLAEILCVGTELLLGEVLNTNTKFISEELTHLGIDLYRQTVVGDNEKRIEKEVRNAAKHCDLIITTGGLGPTVDDITKETVAKALDLDMFLDEDVMDRIKKMFSGNDEAIKVNTKQAYFPVTSTILPNDLGSAPGCLIEIDNKIVMVLPGPPRELQHMFIKYAKPYLQKFSDEMIISININTAGIGEWEMAKKVDDIIDKYTNPTIAPYAGNGYAYLRLTAKSKSKEEAEKLFEPAIAEIKEKLGENIFSIGDQSLANVVSELIIKQDKKLLIYEKGNNGEFTNRFLQDKLGREILIASKIDNTYNNIQDAKDHLKEQLKLINNGENTFYVGIYHNKTGDAYLLVLDGDQELYTYNKYNNVDNLYTNRIFTNRALNEIRKYLIK